MELAPVPSAEWEYEVDTLLRDPWLRKKVDRDRRLREHAEYIAAYCMELTTADPGLVIDLGPGPGEFLELCREMGHDVLGIDAERGYGGMGDKYLAYSQRMTERQGIPVEYIGCQKWLDRDEPCYENVVLVNSRGSVEQALSHCMLGRPHHQHHRADQMTWDLPKAARALQLFFQKCHGLLRSGGHVLVHANGAVNVGQYEVLATMEAERAGLELVYSESPRLHKWVKP